MRTIEAYAFQYRVRVETDVNTKKRGIRMLHILMFMVASYLGVLWLGAILLLLHVPVP
jgi:hypothetical protein